MSAEDDGLDLRTRRKVHILGIGGAGMRAIAGALVDMGHEVSGSDLRDSPWLKRLAGRNVRTHVGHDAANRGDAEVVVRSTAVPDDNVEVVSALAAGLAVHSRAELLAAMTATRSSVLVAGTHGKTTTSSMLAVLLDVVGFDPSFIIGADVERFGTGARWASGATAVIEADESDGTFLQLPGTHAIVTSLDPDHLEHYGSQQGLNAAFVEFVEQTPGSVVVCADDADTGPLLSIDGVVTYGEAESADLRITDVSVQRGATHFTVSDQRAERSPAFSVDLRLPGLHNALNATAAIAMAVELGIPLDRACASVGEFRGVGRRFETRGEVGGATFVDDYAHLPAEVEAALAAADGGDWDRIICTYQPHRYTRTAALGHTFASSFSAADRLVLTDIYPSGESPIDGVTGRILFDAVTAADPDLDVVWQPTLDDVVDHLSTILRPGDLCLTLGAGDLTTVPDLVMDRLRPVALAAVAAELAEAIDPARVWEDERLGPRTTYRVGGTARYLVDIESVDELVHASSVARRHGLELLMVGRGSNLLVADAGFDGLAVMLGEAFESISIDGDNVTLGGAVSLPVAARRLTRAGLTGFEWAVGVPGSIGGAVAMNAGGHGSDMAASTTSATVVDTLTGAVSSWSAADLAFGYRSSAVAGTDCVVQATLHLSPGDPAAGEGALREIVRWRREHQPGGQNAGSVFTNPPGDAAGRLIDAAGCKGMRVGSAEVSAKHANFIQVDPGGSGDDVFELMQQVIARVEERFEVTLHPETRLVGFDGDAVRPDSAIRVDTRIDEDTQS